MVTCFKNATPQSNWAWYDVESPSVEELDKIALDFNLHPAAVQDADFIIRLAEEFARTVIFLHLPVYHVVLEGYLCHDHGSAGAFVVHFPEPVLLFVGHRAFSHEGLVRPVYLIEGTCFVR